MSSDAAKRALAFYGLINKASQLEVRGHLVRAAEIYSRAAEAARALDSGPDNLVAVDLELKQAVVLRNHIRAAANEGVDRLVSAPQRADCVALFSAAVAALARRRAAGTLLEGKCTAAEEVWFAAVLSATEMSAVAASGWGPLVGYHIFLHAAAEILGFFIASWLFAGDCSVSLLHSYARHVVRAADLMRQARSHGTVAMTAEVDFAHRFPIALALARTFGMDARLLRLLMGAWQGLQRSGVLEARGIFNELQHGDQSLYGEKHVAAVHAAVSAPGLRNCTRAGCSGKEAHPQHFKRCSACQAVVYCSKEHQQDDWQAHKAACKETRRAAAGPGAA